MMRSRASATRTPPRRWSRGCAGRTARPARAAAPATTHTWRRGGCGNAVPARISTASRPGRCSRARRWAVAMAAGCLGGCQRPAGQLARAGATAGHHPEVGLADAEADPAGDAAGVGLAAAAPAVDLGLCDLQQLLRQGLEAGELDVVRGRSAIPASALPRQYPAGRIRVVPGRRSLAQR